MGGGEPKPQDKHATQRGVITPPCPLPPMPHPRAIPHWPKQSQTNTSTCAYWARGSGRCGGRATVPRQRLQHQKWNQPSITGWKTTLWIQSDSWKLTKLLYTNTYIARRMHSSEFQHNGWIKSWIGVLFKNGTIFFVNFHYGSSYNILRKEF